MCECTLISENQNYRLQQTQTLNLLWSIEVDVSHYDMSLSYFPIENNDSDNHKYI